MLKAGFSEVVITPQEPVWLVGYAARNKLSTGVHDDLYVKAFYLDHDEKETLFLSFDVLGIDADLCSKVRSLIQEKTGITDILISATHTHSAPATCMALLIGGKELNQSFISVLPAKACEAAIQAKAHSAKATLYSGAIDAPKMTKNRRPNETVADPALTVIKAVDENGKTMGMVVNYACHCTILDSNNYLVTADFPAYLSQMLKEENPDLVTLFINGACGDLNIGYSADASALGANMGNVRTYENAEYFAGYLKRCILECLTGAKPMPEEVYFKPQEIAFPVKDNLPTIGELDKEIAKCAKLVADCTDPEEKPNLEIAKIRNECLKLNIVTHVTGKSIKAGIHIVKIGDVAMMSIPGELFCETGMDLKKVLKEIGDKPMIAGYTDGYLGYMPTRSAFAKGGYECDTSVHKPGVEDMLLKEAHKAASEYQNARKS